MADDAGALDTEQDLTPPRIEPAAVDAASPDVDAGPRTPPSRLQHLRQRVQSDLDRARQARGTSVPVDAGWRFVERNTVAGGLVLAGALAFRIFLFLVPYVFTFVVTLGFYADTATSSTKDALSQAGVTGLLAQAVADVSSTESGVRWVSLIGGALATLWAAYGLSKTLLTVHMLAWGIPRPHSKRAWLHPIYVVLFVTGVLTVSRLLKLARDSIGFLGVLVTLLAIGLVVGIWLALSHRLPHDDGASWRDLLPGALLVGVGVQALNLATVFYFARKMSSLDERYGLIGQAVGMLSWAYMLGWIVTASAMLNASIYEAARRRSSG